ncbi:MAG: hydroxypyruvate isomerase family protein [Methylobacteriaceae bacterium]|nr:hydroxypyruvate isomerase family protein [Methylobacteriaceae bacterium]
MPRFSANLTMMFTERPFLERFGAAAAAGFKAVEYVSPYEHPREVVAAELKRFGLVQALFNLPAGNWAAGERGIACHPNRIGEFHRSVATAIDYAQALGCTRLNCLSGLALEGVNPALLRRTFVDNLKYAARETQKAGITLVAEAINPIDMPGFFLNTSRQAMEIFDEVDSDNLFFQYDIYHMQRQEGELAATLERLMPRIRHIQIASNPGRHEPDEGEIAYPYLFAHIDRLGYDGWVGAEYRPRARTEDGLAWFAPYRGLA